MSSIAQTLANQQNAAKSTGPATAEGKARVAQNAFQHGFRSRSLFLSEAEQAEFDQFSADFHQEYQPQTPTERVWLDELIAAGWKKQQCRTQETAWLREACLRLLEDRPELGTPEQMNADPLLADRVIAIVQEREAKQWDRYRRYDRDLSRQWDKALKSLEPARQRAQKRVQMEQMQKQREQQLREAAPVARPMPAPQAAVPNKANPAPAPQPNKANPTFNPALKTPNPAAASFNPTQFRQK